eukprot:TRINITY_DN9023_c0_g1_i2.p1 TRINITY_DN9023_c0_g1~~TRINITY_DN9023_c0_g1_i2.p1  ORF type:complete len:937 (+),score=302.57 TRINITY_DN9023_c0_g1_i2:144-2954(+)
MSEKQPEFDDAEKKHDEKAEEEDVGCLQKVSEAIHKKMEAFFGGLAKLVVDHAWTTLAVCVVFFAIMANGVWFYEEDFANDKQFTPRDSQAVKDQTWVIDHFGSEEVRTVTVYFKASSGTNVLSKESLLYVQDYHDYITSLYHMIDGVNVTYEVVCSRYSPQDSCKSAVSILSFWKHNRTLLEADPDPLNTINTANWKDVVPSGPAADYYMSGLSYDTNGKITSGVALRMFFYLKNEKKTISGVGFDDPQSRYWEIHASEETESRRSADIKAHKVGPYCYTIGWEYQAAIDAVDSGISGLIMGYVAMILYATFILSRSRFKYSHSILGIASVISVAMSTFAAYGFCWYLGIKFNTIVQVLILVLLGVGIDDTFVIMDSWWDCAEEPDMKERMILALKHAGPAITITSLTDLVAFLSSSTTSFPALHDFCFYASVGIIFDFGFQVTFLVALAFLDTRRQDANRADILCCIKVEDDTGICINKEEKWTESNRGLQNYILGSMLPKATLSVPGKVIVLVLSALFLGTGIWGSVSELKMNYNSEWSIAHSHPIHKTWDVRDKYFAGDTVSSNIFFGEIDYPNNQTVVARGIAILDASKWVVAGSTSSWVYDFQKWVNATYPADFQDSIVVPARFYPLLKIWANTTTGPEETWFHIDNIRWDDNGEKLVASRCAFSIISDVNSNGESAVSCMHDLRHALDEVDAFPWSWLYIFWESYDRMIPEATRNVIMAVSCVFVLVTLLIANIAIGFLCVIAIGCVDVCMLGFMPLIGVDLNSVSIVCIVLAVGLAVDYSVHIANAFLQVKAVDNEQTGVSARSQRAAYAVWKMGPAVFNGGTSTFIAVFPACFAETYIFQAFFRMFFLIIVFGLWFGVFFVPVVLSLIGPAPYAHAHDLADHPGWNPLDPEHHFDHSVSSEQPNEPFNEEKAESANEPIVAVQKEEA